MSEKPQLPFAYSALPERALWRFPGGAGLAAWVVVNIEHFEYGKLGTAIQPHLTSLPEIANYGWRDYGNRVGIWRMFELFDKYPQVKVTATVNADICRYYPQIMQAALQRGWEIMAHGLNNSTGHANLDATVERALINETLAIIEEFTGQRPVGWLTPGFSVTTRTNDLLYEAGIRYSADWVNDDQPYYLHLAENRRMVAVPYTLETNDITLCLSARLSGPDYAQAVSDQFEVLRSESSHAPRIFTLALHPFIVGQPLRLPYLEKVVRQLAESSGVWLATGAEIAAYYSTLEKA